MSGAYTFGRRTEETRALQAALSAHGFDPGAADGIFGRQTQAAVVAARAAYGLAGTGVDAALLRALGLLPAASTLTDVVLRAAIGAILSQLKGRLPMSFLAGYRTYIVAGAMLLTGVAGLLGVDLPSFTGQAPGTLVMEALAFFFLRQGLKTDAGNG